MLCFLQIRNYAIVESLDLEFTGGFTCVTGETGAGKSILVDALGLLCGNRADSGAVRSGAARAELSAGFELPDHSAALEWLRSAEMDDGGACLLRRVINANGRSRAWINGVPVTLQQLAAVGERLVEIHGQNEHILLTRREEQFRLLDGGGAYSAELESVRERHAAWAALERERLELLGETPLDAGDLDLLRHHIRELEEDLLPAERFAEIESEHRVLSRGGQVLAALDECLQLLDSEQAGAGPALHRAAAALEEHAGLDADIAAAVDLLRESAIACDEAQISVRAARSRVDLSPEHLADLERQLSRQHDLARKHRVEPEQLGQVLTRLQERHERAGSLEARLAAVEKGLAEALSRYRRAAAELHARRVARAGELAGGVTALMQELGMQGGVFGIDVHLDEESTPAAGGSDRIELQVSANPGVPPGPLRKVASGGELSRISLAIKVASRGGVAAATQVFDEVDAGIGGETANAVGALLRSLSSEGQALCVTHLAQVAAFADRQIQVQKTSDESETRIETSLLGESERVEEIARMLSGRSSEQSRAHASELLALASTRH